MNEFRQPTPPSVKAKNKRHYLKMLAEGRCCSCGKADDLTRQGRARCAACNAKAHHKERKTKAQCIQSDQQEPYGTKREWAKMRKDAHLCIDCGRKDARTINGKCQCKQCAKKRADMSKEKWDAAHEKELREARKARWVAAGLCSNCGHPKEEPDKALCINCKVRAKMRKERHKINTGWMPRGANGKCFQCNRAPAMEGKRLCPACYEKKVATLRANSARRKEKKDEEADV